MVTEDESQHTSSLGSSSDKNDPLAMQIGISQGYTGKKPFIQWEHCGLKATQRKIVTKL